MQALTDLGQFSRREVDAFLLRVSALLLTLSARKNRLELRFHRLDGVGEISQLGSDAGDVLVVGHLCRILRRRPGQVLHIVQYVRYDCTFCKVVGDLRPNGATGSPHVEHPTGSSGATTGAPLNGNAVRAKSIDQIVADVTGTGPDFKSLEVGVTPATPNGPQDSLHSVSHRGPSARNDALYDPKKVFTKLFMGGTTTPPGNGTPMPDAMAKLNAVKKSMLDSCIEDGEALKKKLGAADKLRVQEHLDAIRRIELRLQNTSTGNTGGTKPPACTGPSEPTVGADMGSEAPPAVNTAMVELSALALACEKTRVLTFMFSLPAAHVYYRHLDKDMNADFHDTICHGDPGDASNQPRVDKGVMYAMKCFNEFLTKLKGTAFGASTLLDASLIFVTSDTAWGSIHTKEEWPVLLAGKAGGKLKGDVHLNFPGDNLSKALFTVAKVMGSNVTELGADAGKVNATLSGVTA